MKKKNFYLTFVTTISIVMVIACTPRHIDMVYQVIGTVEKINELPDNRTEIQLKVVLFQEKAGYEASEHLDNPLPYSIFIHNKSHKLPKIGDVVFAKITASSKKVMRIHVIERATRN